MTVRPHPGAAGPLSPRPPAVARALAFIEDPARDRFEEVALDLFAFQFEHNPAYRRFCRRRGVDPSGIGGWERIPFVPAAGFKAAPLVSWPFGGDVSPERVFLTSGTTQGAEVRGRHVFPELALYEAAWPGPFRRHLLPDRERMRMLSLVPGETSQPESSLSFMVSRALERFGARGSGFLLEGPGFDRNALARDLAAAVEDGEPVLLVGTGFAFAALLEAIESGDGRCPLPAGSRIMDTGGTKGRTREFSRGELLDRFERGLGVPATHVVGEYGMTELSSQYYETSLVDHGRGIAPRTPRRFMAPPWMRPRVLDPETLNPRPPGEPGLLAHLDLANAWTVAAVLTEDLGALREDGLVLLGRARGAELRGCSLATEALLDG